MDERKLLRRGRRWLLGLNVITYYIVFGGICTYFIFKLLPSPLDWIVTVWWLAWVLPQPITYIHRGNGAQMNDRYIETGKYDPGQWKDN